MHDMMHDLAKEVADECATVEDLIQQKVSIHGVYHLPIISTHQQLKEITPLFRGTINLRTLLTPPSAKDLVNANLRSLRAVRFRCAVGPVLGKLNLTPSRDSSIFLRKLIQTPHLRYLDLSGSVIDCLPDAVCMLYNLLSLRLNDCVLLQNLPEGMSCMRKLSHIYLLGCCMLKRMPPNLSLMHNLHILTTFVVSTEDGRGIEELENLQQLGNRLQLYHLQKVKDGSRANLHMKQKLNELLLYWDFKETGYTNDEVATQERVLESLVPHGELKILEVHGYGGRTVSHWMRKSEMFMCLRELTMTDCCRCRDLPAIWLLPSLERLSLAFMENLTTLCKNMEVEPKACNTPMQIFPKVKRMDLYSLDRLEKWAENSAGETISLVMFPELKVLTIINCNKLTTLPEFPVLIDLHAVYASETPYRELTGSVRDVMMPLDGQQTHLKALRNLFLGGDDTFISIFKESKLQLGLRGRLALVEKLDIMSCSNIVRWPLEELRCLPCLLYLRLSHCIRLEGMGSSMEEAEILPLPLLERLGIENCASLLEIPQVPTSLEKLWILDCNSLVALPSNLEDLPKLMDLRIICCSGLKVLPDGIDGLTSLELLTITECEGIDELLKCFLQRLPSLKYLNIRGSPGLQRRCREGGEYFDLVSSIPTKFISGEALPRPVAILD